MNGFLRNAFKARKELHRVIPLSMFFYAIVVLPLIRSLASKPSFLQYADDSVCAGNLSNIRLRLDKLILLGTAYDF